MELQPLGAKPFIVLLVLLAIGPTVMALALGQRPGMESQLVFWGVPSFFALCLLVLGTSMRRRRVAIEDGQLRVKSTFYTAAVSLSAITEVRRITRDSTDDRIGLRLNGMGLPGFQSGWFAWRPGGRVLVDRAAGDYLLVSVEGKPRLALGFADNLAAARALKEAGASR